MASSGTGDAPLEPRTASLPADETGNIGPHLPPIGTIVGGKYLLEDLVGRGGMGVVLSAKHLVLRERVALKFVAASSRAGAARLLREARLAAAIKSDYVARVLDVGALDSGVPYVVMEHLEGESLAKMLRARGALPIDEALALADEICCGLAAAHALGIVHRDLKPSNVFVTRQPDGSRRVKIVDFGVAKKLATKTGSDEDDGALTSSTTVLGSPFYMAPEQVRSARDVDARADLWSLGATLYEMLSGKPPFVAETTPGVLAAVVADRPRALRESIPAIPRRLEAVVMRCLEKNRDARWADVESLRAALAEVPSRTDQEIAASTPPEAHDATKEKDEKNEAARRRKRTIALGAAALAVVVVGGRLLLGTNASAEAPMRPFVATSTAEGTIAATPPAAPVPAPIEAKIEASPHVTEPVATTSKETAERREPTSHRKTAPRASPSPSPTPTATPSAMPSQTAPAPVAAPPASFTPRPDVSAATADRH